MYCQYDLRTFRTADYSYDGWTIRTLDVSYYGPFVPRLFVCWTYTEYTYNIMAVPYVNIPLATSVSVNTTSAPSAKILHRPFDGVLLLNASAAVAAQRLAARRRPADIRRRRKLFVSRGAASHSRLVSEALNARRVRRTRSYLYVRCQCGVRRRRAVAHASDHRWL